MSRLSVFEVAIASGASLSNEADLRDHRLIAIQMPAAFTDPVNGLTFQGTAYSDGTRSATALTETFLEVVDDAGVAVAIANAAAQAATFITLRTATRDLLAGLARIKVRSGTAGGATNQGAARKITLICEPRDAMS